jgi:phage FluMu protein Com
MDEWTLNDLLECSVCLDRLDTSSKVLPCQHTFCRKCLLDIYQAHKELRCPECRVLIECGIDELPTNVLLMRILEGMKHPNKNNPPKGSPTVPLGVPQGVPDPRHHHHRHHHSATQGSKSEQPPKQVLLKEDFCI